MSGEPSRLQVVVAAEQEGIRRRDVEPFQGRKRLREFAFRFDLGIQQAGVVEGGPMEGLEQLDGVSPPETSP